MEFTNKSVRINYISGEVETYHHADLVKEDGVDFIYVTVGSRQRKTVLIPVNRVSKIELVDSQDKDQKEEN